MLVQAIQNYRDLATMLNDHADALENKLDGITGVGMNGPIVEMVGRLSMTLYQVPNIDLVPKATLDRLQELIDQL